MDEIIEDDDPMYDRKGTNTAMRKCRKQRSNDDVKSENGES
ncbi:7360_t:CDS:2 [Paraglomus occultum]|uniref:7360_t:CDS:1 n=1 Tax=Paraglomus occultum TaxID=144539 RepID=A0A9N9GJU6_9GLOM|nr:7360_t:CDS:2 [Paraglomus occultum]